MFIALIEVSRCDKLQAEVACGYHALYWGVIKFLFFLEEIKDFSSHDAACERNLKR